MLFWGRPKRIQLQRARGWKLPRNAVVVARGSKWENPYEGLPDSIGQFLFDLEFGRLSFSVEDVRRELRGRTLACWCPLNLECHADILLAVANGYEI